ncbi:MAG TPA: cation:proton antiporter, partial [Gemmatimonadales bacterium]|nr:cation:proton antiporter [Gemmatimonadales bacterium]
MLLLGVAAAGLGAARLARLPSLVGYLVAGVVAGPAVLGLLHRTRELETIAELGVALLLFGVGIEFSLEQLRRALPRVLPAAALQLAVTIVAAAALFHGLGLAWPNAVLVGFIVSLSSTAVVFKLYGETGELEAPHGQAAAGILLLQDLALVAMMLLVPALAAPQAGVAGRAGLALVIAAAALAGLLVLARLVLPRALALVARARTPELFPLAALLAAFGTALVAWRVGLSLPIGAFLAGLALSGSPYAHQVFAELLPLRDAFVAVFFTSIGLLFTPEALLGAPGLLVAVLAAVALKAAVTVGVVLLFWRSPVVALQTGLALGQIGEFSFVLATAGYGAHLLGEPLFQAVLGAAILAMAATPFLIRLGWRLSRAGAARPARDAKDAPRDHVLLIGYGETGRAVARVLREIGVPF